MNDSFHYLSMANHMMVQKKLMEQLKDTGLTLGQPKVLDFIMVPVKKTLPMLVISNLLL